MPAALVVPGLLSIDPRTWEGPGDAEIEVGWLAGRAGLPELTDWKRELWLAPPEVALRPGGALPQARLNMNEAPRLAALLDGAALVVVDAAVGARAAAARDTVIVVSYHRVSGGGGLEVHGSGGVRGFSAEDGDLFAQVEGRADSADPDEDDADREASTEHVYDRVLRAITGGTFSLRDVELADHATRIQADDVTSYEAELAWIAAEAERGRGTAEQLVLALAAPGPDTRELPGGYRARRIPELAFTLHAEGGVTLTGAPVVVPAGERWVAADVGEFLPPPRKARRDRALAGNRSRRASLGSSRPFAVPGGALAAALMVGLLVLGFLRGGGPKPAALPGGVPAPPFALPAGVEGLSAEGSGPVVYHFRVSRPVIEVLADVSGGLQDAGFQAQARGTEAPSAVRIGGRSAAGLTSGEVQGDRGSERVVATLRTGAQGTEVTVTWTAPGAP